MKTCESGMPPEELWQSFFDPIAVLTRLGLDTNCGDVLEFGCGYGTFTIPAAKLIREKVYAIDIEPGILAIAGEKAKAVGTANVELMQRDFVVDGCGLADSTVDYAMLSTSFMLKSEWLVCVKQNMRPKPGHCRAWAEEVGFIAVSPADIDLPPYHFGLVLERGCLD